MRLVIIFALGIGVVVGLWALERRRRRLPSLLQSRRDLPLSEIKGELFGDVAITLDRFTELWNDVATAFEVPSGRIRPGDRFGVELAFRPAFGMNDEDVALAGSLKRRCKELGISTPNRIPKTVDDYIRLLAGGGLSSGSDPQLGKAR